MDIKFDHGGDIYSGISIHTDYSVNTNPLGMPERIKKALIDNMDSYSRYPDPHCRELTAAIAEKEGIPPEYILCGNGAADLIFRLCLGLRPEKALICAPSFSEYENGINAAGGKIRYHYLNEDEGFLITPRILDDINGDTVFVCNPNNPTGRLTDTELLLKILERCTETGGRLVIDECFLEFTHGESMKKHLAGYPNLFILKAFTKTYAMAGLRLGYLLCGDENALDRIKSMGQHWSVSIPAQVAGLSALEENGWMDKTRRLIDTEKAYLTQELLKMGQNVYPSDCNYLLIKGTPHVFKKLLQRGVLVRSCHNFRGLGEDYFRICIKGREENEKFLKTFREAIYG